MELPVAQLHQPPRESRLIREADPTFVRHLKMKMVGDPSAPGATPMAVLCKDMDNPPDFNPKFKSVYKYEVLGGMHTLLAKTQLSTEYPDNPYFKFAIADVYVGLSDEQCLRLAQRHNLNSHFVHKVTHRDLVSLFLFLRLIAVLESPLALTLPVSRQNIGRQDLTCPCGLHRQIPVNNLIGLHISLFSIIQYITSNFWLC